MEFRVEVMLQLSETATPYRVEVSLRELHYLDRNAERTFAPDGTVLYRLRDRASAYQFYAHNAEVIRRNMPMAASMS